MPRYFLTVVVIGTLCLCLSGCSKPNKPEGFPPLYPCEVTIKMNGAALEGANVKFQSADARWPSGSVTNAKGVAEISTFGHAGVPEGDYKVLVSKYELPAVTDDNTPQRGGDNPAAKPLVHQKFRSAATTPLSCTVTKGGPNRFEFTVE